MMWRLWPNHQQKYFLSYLTWSQSYFCLAFFSFRNTPVRWDEKTYHHVHRKSSSNQSIGYSRWMPGGQPYTNFASLGLRSNYLICNSKFSFFVWFFFRNLYDSKWCDVRSIHQNITRADTDVMLVQRIVI